MFTTMPAQVSLVLGSIVLGLLGCCDLSVSALMHPSPIAGLFEVHKLLFSFAMTTKIQEVESSLSHEELNFFIKVW